MGQVRRLNLQIAKHGQDLGHGDIFADFENVEKTRYVFLYIELHPQRLECHILNAPQISHLTIGVHLELGDALEESVNVVHIGVEHLLSGVLYQRRNEKTSQSATNLIM